MKKTILKLIKLNIGLLLYGFGIVMTINANQGLAPWDVFHQGLGLKLNLTIGISSIIVGFAILIVNYFLGEKIGWGTVLNMVMIGIYIDILMINNIVPIFESIIASYLMLLVGLFVIGCASYFYIGAGFGSGPRDGLMVAIAKRSKFSVRVIRSSIEIIVLIIGYFLGGKIGIGTAVMAFSIGYFVQLAFKIFKFDVTTVNHRYINDDILYIKNKILSCQDNK